MNRTSTIKPWRVFAVVLCILAPFCSPAQMSMWPGSGPGIHGVSNMDSPGAFLSDMVAYLRSRIRPSDTLEGGPRQGVDNFEHFWAKRVQQNGATSPNMFERYFLNLSHEAYARKTTANCPAPNIWGGNWICNGPDSMADMNIGFITVVWADPADTTRLLVGTHGGLFRSMDGGRNWTCISDPAPISTGLIDITSIAVHPVYKHIIYCGTSSEVFIPNFREWGGGRDYGAGLIYTNNGWTTTGLPSWGQEFPRTTTAVNWRDSTISVGGVYFTPNGDRLYALSGARKLYWRNYSPPAVPTAPPVVSTAQWKDANVPYRGVEIGLADMRFKPNNNNDSFFIGGNAKWLYIGKFSSGSQAHTYDSIRHPFISIPAYQVIDTLGNIYTLPASVISEYAACKLRMPQMNSLYGLFRWYRPDPNNDTFTHKPMQFVNSADAGPHDLLARWHFNGGGYWSINNQDVPMTGPVGSGSCMNFAVSSVDTNFVYYGNAVAQFSNDGGRNSWTDISVYAGNPTHADVRNLYVHSFVSAGTAGAGDRLYFATDGGVMMKTRGVAPFAAGALTCKNIDGKGLAAGDYVGVGTSEGGRWMMGGAIHVGFQAYEADQNPKWLHVGFGDKENVVFNRKNPAEAFGTEWQDAGDIERTSTSSGRRIDNTNWISNLNEHGAYNYPNLWSDKDGNIYVGLQHIWRYDPANGYQIVNGPAAAPGLNIKLPEKKYPGTPPREIPIAGMALSTYHSSSPNLAGYVLREDNTLYYRAPGSAPSTSFSTAGLTGPTSSYPLTGITTDMGNPEKVWVSCGGENTSNTPKNRVFYSKNHGTSGSWCDISSGLPAHLPVSAIVYQEGSPWVYAATDAGMFRADMSGFDLTKSSTGYGVTWQCFNNGAVTGRDFPSVYVSKLEINYCEGKLYASTYGRSIWSTDIMMQDPSYYSKGLGDFVPTPSYQITSNTLWNTDQRIYGGVRVMPGVTLTINNTPGSLTTIHMPKNGAIVVDSGATLIVDGAKITNDCGYFWKGILVRGNPNKPQTPNTNQGIAIIKNSAIIEHARLGAANYSEGVMGPKNDAGGILKIDNSFFYNCARGVGFAPYHNIVGGKYLDNLSYVKGCTFEVNNNYRGEAVNYGFLSHIAMSNVDGINIQGDTFRNVSTQATIHNSGVGINSWSSGYNVIPYCASGVGCPVSFYKHNVFKGFNIAINSNDGSLNPLNYCFVDYADFSDNGIGLYAKYNNWCEVFHNNFKMAPDGIPFSSTCNCQKGVFIRQSTQFRIEENNFAFYKQNRKNPPGVCLTYGAEIDSSGAMINDIYHNNFNMVDVSIAAMGNNANNPMKVTATVPAIGLQATCNTFLSSSSKPWLGTPIASGVPTGSGAGTHVWGTNCLRIWQGDSIKPAENIFNYTGTNPSYNYRIMNNTRYVVYWYHNPPAAGVDVGAVYKYSGAINTCPARKIVVPPSYNGGTYQKIQAIENFSAHKLSLADATQVLAGKINGGNTTQLISYINASMGGPILRDALLSLAPYLTAEPLMLAATNNKVPKPMMMDVLIACPEQLTDELLYYLGNDMPAPYPQDDIELLRMHQTERTQLSRDIELISDSYREMRQDHGDIIRFLKHDTDGLDVDTLAYWYKQLPETWTRYAAAMMYLGAGQYDKSDEVMNAIADEFELTGDSLNEYNSYKNIIAILKPVLQDERNELQLDSTELSGMLEIAQRGHAKASFLAQNIYDQNLDIQTIPCMELPPPDTSAEIDPGKRLAHQVIGGTIPGVTAKKDFVNVYPNPAQEQVSFNYSFPSVRQAMQLSVMAINGKVIYSVPLNGQIGVIRWDASAVKPGIYSYTIKTERGLIANGKVTIIK